MSSWQSQFAGVQSFQVWWDLGPWKEPETDVNPSHEGLDGNLSSAIAACTLTAPWGRPVAAPRSAAHLGPRSPQPTRLFRGRAVLLLGSCSPSPPLRCSAALLPSAERTRGVMNSWSHHWIVNCPGLREALSPRSRSKPRAGCPRPLQLLTATVCWTPALVSLSERVSVRGTDSVQG